MVASHSYPYSKLCSRWSCWLHLLSPWESWVVYEDAWYLRRKIITLYLIPSTSANVNETKSCSFITRGKLDSPPDETERCSKIAEAHASPANYSAFTLIPRVSQTVINPPRCGAINIICLHLGSSLPTSLNTHFPWALEQQLLPTSITQQERFRRVLIQRLDYIPIFSFIDFHMHLFFFPTAFSCNPFSLLFVLWRNY